MYIVVIHNWPEVTSELSQALAGVMRATAFDARQRLVGRGPAVVGSFVESGEAEALCDQLKQGGFKTFVFDSDRGSPGSGLYVVHRFELAAEEIRIEVAGGGHGNFLYHKADLLLPASRIVQQAESQTVTDRKFSLGKTIVAGGLPMKRSVQRREVVTTEDRERVLYLCVGGKPRFVFPQNSLAFDGLGTEMQPTRESNFNYLTSELRRRCGGAEYDDRLLNRTEQAKILGSLLAPETYLELAVIIVAMSTSVKNG